VTFGFSPTERYKVYYKEGSGASSQRLQAMQSLCLRFSLLNPSHHFHSTYTNHLLFLVVQVDPILNSRLWVRFNPIWKLQHTLSTSKMLWIKKHAQPSSSSVVSLWDPPLGLLRNLGAHQKWCNGFSMDNLKHKLYIARNLWDEEPLPSL